MADSTREAALKALFAVLDAISGPSVARNKAVPKKIPAGGHIAMKDGDPGDPDAMLSPPTDAWDHRVQLELYVQQGEDAARAASLDTLGQAVGLALDADRTLGGKVQSLTYGPLVTDHEGVEGAAAVGKGDISVYLHYETAEGGLA